MRVRREDVEKLHMRQLEHLGRQIEARETKAKHIATRKRWLERQTNANYRNEYDRIRGELSHFRGSTVDRRKLQNRVEALQRLFSSGSV